VSFTLKKIVSGGLLLTIGQGGAQLLTLLRNAIYGHFLSPEDFGVAAIFAFTISAIEMASDMGADKLLIQSKDGNKVVLQNTAHFYNVTRGLIGALVIFFISPFIVTSFDIKGAEWAFNILSIVVFIRGFFHLDIKRLHRKMNYTPFVLTEFIAQLLTSLLVYPFVLYYRNYDAVIYLILLHALFYLLMSHYYARRKYRLIINGYYFKKIFNFGWPLILNGILMYIIIQGDKLIIGSYYNISTLGIYSAAFMISMMPALLIIKSLTSIILPLFSKQQNVHNKLNLYYRVVTDMVIFIAFAYSITFIMFGDLILSTVFGEQYLGYDKLIAALGIMWSLRIIRVPSTLLAMAKGNTQVAMVANCFRALVLGMVIFLALNKHPIELIAYCGSAGEIIAIFISIYQIKYKFNINAKEFFGKLTILILLISLSVYLSLILKNNFNFWHEIIFYFIKLLFMFFFLLKFSKYKSIFQKQEVTFVKKP
jgi:O-antigen/teichoic acid export membrane protein